MFLGFSSFVQGFRVRVEGFRASRLRFREGSDSNFRAFWLRCFKALLKDVGTGFHACLRMLLIADFVLQSLGYIGWW